MAHWVSEFKRCEVPSVVSEVKIHEESETSESKMTVQQRHASTVAWNSKSYTNNNIETCRPPLSNYQKCTSKKYLYVQDHEESRCESGSGKGKQWCVVIEPEPSRKCKCYVETKCKKEYKKVCTCNCK